MRTFIAALSVLGVLLVYCLVRSILSEKPLSRPLSWLLFFSLVPLAGNVLVMVSDRYVPSLAGYMMYLVGTDWMLYFLVKFSAEYCDYRFSRTPLQAVLASVAALDTVSILLNPLFLHVFGMHHVILAGGDWYYKLVSGPFHWPHLAFSYALVVLSFVMFIRKMMQVSRLYLEKYLVIFIALVALSVWESWYVFSKTPVDKSMLGYAVCGILIWYFSLEYLPFFLTEKMLSTVVSNISDAILFIDNKEKCIYFNESASKLLSVQPGDYDGARRKLLEIMTEDDMRACESMQVIKNLVRGQEERMYELEFQKLYDARSVYAGAFVSIKDRTEEEAEKRREQFLATHDSLTGLYNREYLLHKMERRLAENPGTDYLILCSDIKEFKLVNDIFGRSAGDEILVNVAKLVVKYASENAVYGRIGGDTFAVMMRRQDYDEELFVRGSGGFVHKEGSMVYPITIHIGVYEVKERNIPPSIMIDRAFLAMEGIKDSVQTRIAWYDDAMRESLLWAQRVTASFDEALTQRQFKPYLQAQVSRDGAVDGAEVLVRWEHPSEGLMQPGRFISILEDSGDIVRLDRYMWEEACRILARWKDEGRESMYLSVNISPKDFYYIDVYEEISSLVRKYGIEPRRLRLEITESVMINDVERKMQIINWFRGDGFIVEMDDFGSGYSSLNLLKNLQVDVLKLDMLFLRQSSDSQRAQTILQYIISMAQRLRMPVITEGVETLEQVTFLTDAGCDMFQGYYFSKPIPLEEFEAHNF